jgi:hypothetical protein
VDVSRRILDTLLEKMILSLHKTAKVPRNEWLDELEILRKGYQAPKNNLSTCEIKFVDSQGNDWSY